MNHSILLAASLSCCMAACAADYGEPDTDDSLEVDELTQGLAALEIRSYQNVKSELCIGVDRASVDNGALLKQFPCDGALNQRWEDQPFILLHQLKNVKSRACMGVDGGSRSPGANIGQYNCDLSDNQGWVMNRVGGTDENPVVTLENENPDSNRCIGVDGASLEIGAQLKQFTCDGRVNQKWRKVEP